MVIIVICLLMEKKSLILKLMIKALTFQLKYCLGTKSNGFIVTIREVSLKGNVYDFSVYYNSIDKSNMLKFHKHLMVKYNLK